MEYNIVYTACAERDIWQIADYLSDYSVEAAENFLHTVKDRIERLAKMPLMYPKINFHQVYRKMPVGDYVVVYQINEHARQVVILRVVHGRRNYQTEL